MSIIQPIRRFISNNRKNLFLRGLYKFAKGYMNIYFSSGYEGHKNGEEYVMRKVGKHFAGPTTIFDIGCNLGVWARPASECFSKPTIHCFELSPPTFEKLQKNLQEDTFILVNKGLSDKNETIEFYHSEKHSGRTSQFNFMRNDFVKLQGKVVTGDSYIAANKIQQIHFAKIDVEGGEGKVLRGLQKAIDKGIIDVIQFEYGFVNIKSKFLLMDFYDTLGENYTLGRIAPTHVDFKNYDPLEDENFYAPNFLAVHKKHKRLIKELSK